MKKFLLLIFLTILNFTFAQQDCDTALGICGNSTVTYNPVGYGNTSETIGDCFTLTPNEHNSVWYKFTIATSGTLTFTITPTTPADYDWAIFGPNVSCANKGTPIRCNACQYQVPTGMNMTAVNTSEPAGPSNPWSKYMDVVAGQTYYLFIDNWVGNGVTNMSPFTLTWGGTATLTSPFTDPVLSPQPFLPPGSPAANPNDPREIYVCSDPTTFNFNTLTPGIVNGNPNFIVSYHKTQNDALSGANPITAPEVIVFGSLYFYSIRYNHPSNPNSPLNICRQVGPFKFIYEALDLQDATLSGCNNLNAGTAVFDLTTANVYSGNLSVTKKYYTTAAATVEILAPTTYSSPAGSVYVKVFTPHGCAKMAKITLTLEEVKVQGVTLSECTNNHTTSAVFNLDLANVYPNPTQPVTRKYYPTYPDAVAGTSEITNYNTYSAPSGSFVYAKVISNKGCFNIAKITLMFKPAVIGQEDTLRVCFMEEDPTKGKFNLSLAVTTTTPGASIKKYYPTLNDANAGTNEITNPLAYIAPSGFVYVRIFNIEGCYDTVKITLIVYPQVFSPILKDKVICQEDLTTLDAGPGFSSYEWNNGATTSSITNVGVGTYWVKLRTGDCFTKHVVNVLPYTKPVISSIDVGFKTFKAYVKGGTPPYKYSLDGSTWQDSNEFNNLPRGDIKLYVKDANDCDPVTIDVTIPNIVNALTVNGDGKNEAIDYSALSHKKNLEFTVFNKYGNLIYKADKFHGYKWNGMMYDKRLNTDTYWFYITWNENDSKSTPFKYSGWILIKNK